MESVLSLWKTIAFQCTFTSLPSLTCYIVLYNVNLFLQIESDFLKFFIFISFQKYEPAFFFFIVRNILFYNIVDSVNMDMLGFGSLSRSQGIVHNRKYWTKILYHGGQCFFHLNSDLTFFFVQKSTVFLNSLLPSKIKSV